MPERVPVRTGYRFNAYSNFDWVKAFCFGESQPSLLDIILNFTNVLIGMAFGAETESVRN